MIYWPEPPHVHTVYYIHLFPRIEHGTKREVSSSPFLATELSVCLSSRCHCPRPCSSVYVNSQRTEISIDSMEVSSDALCDFCFSSLSSTLQLQCSTCWPTSVAGPFWLHNELRVVYSPNCSWRFNKCTFSPYLGLLSTCKKCFVSFYAKRWQYGMVCVNLSHIL